MSRLTCIMCIVINLVFVITCLVAGYISITKGEYPETFLMSMGAIFNYQCMLHMFNKLEKV